MSTFADVSPCGHKMGAAGVTKDPLSPKKDFFPYESLLQQEFFSPQKPHIMFPLRSY